MCVWNLGKRKTSIIEFIEMDPQDTNTFLEEFISSSELLPTEVRRNFELMRELDRDVTEITRQVEDGEVRSDDFI